MKIVALVPLLMLTSCYFDADQMDADDAANEAQRVLRSSTIVCADGNQVRMAVYAFGTNVAAFSGWTILDENGKPKRCVKRPKAVTQYEEVPQ